MKKQDWSPLSTDFDSNLCCVSLMRSGIHAISQSVRARALVMTLYIMMTRAICACVVPSPLYVTQRACASTRYSLRCRLTRSRLVPSGRLEQNAAPVRHSTSAGATVRYLQREKIRSLIPLLRGGEICS